MNDTRIIFHAEGSNIKGSGHVARSLGIALDMLNRNKPEFIVTYATSSKDICNKLLSDWFFYKALPSFIFFTTPSPADWGNTSQIDLNNLINIPRFSKKEILITDGKNPWLTEDWRKLKDRYDFILSIDNLNAIDTLADAVIFPTNYFTFPIKTINKNNIYHGSRWQWLNPTLESIRQPKEKTFQTSIFMGGADPFNQTKQALLDLSNLNQLEKILVIIGPLYKFEESLRKFCNQKEIIIEKANSNFLEDLIKANISLCSFGLSSIELTFLQQPTILYSHDLKHLEDTSFYISNNPKTCISRTQWLNGEIPIKPRKKKLPRITDPLLELINSLLFKKNNL